MIEREFIKERTLHLKVKEYLDAMVGSTSGIGGIKIEKTPLGEKIIIEAVRPGLIIGRGGKIIQELTVTLRNKFKFENPHIEVIEIEQPNLSASVMAKKVASDLERFGASRFKAIGYRTLTQIMRAGALGAEVVIGGRGVPGARAHTWRFPAGYMKKSGQIALEQVDYVKTGANLRSGTVGIQVRIMHPSIQLPDRITILEDVVIPEDVQKEIDALEKIEKKAEKKSKKSKTVTVPQDETTEIEDSNVKTKSKTKKSDTSEETENNISEEDLSKTSDEVVIETKEGDSQNDKTK
uniref:30S ribosomal protein S3 n=1 Tax=uncultured organism TaxID=155900 RepID=U3GQS8_9ZZZZ|nr:30S ribosomal protein S3 [uncultured organism]